MAYTPQRGDIIHLQFDPATGHEMQGKHYALVISSAIFNTTGLALVCPISQGAAQMARNQGMLVTLMGSGTHTQGAIHCHQVKTLDWRMRQAQKKEAVSDYIVQEVQARIDAIVHD